MDPQAVLKTQLGELLFANIMLSTELKQVRDELDKLKAAAGAAQATPTPPQ